MSGESESAENPVAPPQSVSNGATPATTPEMMPFAALRSWTNPTPIHNSAGTHQEPQPPQGVTPPEDPLPVAEVKPSLDVPVPAAGDGSQRLTREDAGDDTTGHQTQNQDQQLQEY